ncbi:MAG: Thiamine-monophosphate kinase [Alphaproteobacteria bacterium MarineAlpha5_Bin9]|nr:MAG: Thiamine-monophosphate kinase [Alphaproteobacteria bacterium MarineAlpha5_Bin9]
MNLSENIIITKFLQKLNFKMSETYNFKNDGAYIKIPKNNKLIVTNDSIFESVDFFKNDPPESIAIKIVTINLSDLSAMGCKPYAYTLSLGLPKNISVNWLNRFTKKLYFLQKKYNFFLIGGDLSNTNRISISSNFFGKLKVKNKILLRSGSKLNDDIWLTGNLGESAIGLKIKQKKITLNPLYKKYYINKYLYPKHCFLGDKISQYASSAIDISDGFYGDLNKLIEDNHKGASIKSNFIPYSQKTNKLIKNKKISVNYLLSSGDDYELLFTSNVKNSMIIKKLANKNNIKITKVGKIIQKKGIYIDEKKVNIINKSFQHFF